MWFPRGQNGSQSVTVDKLYQIRVLNPVSAGLLLSLPEHINMSSDTQYAVTSLVIFFFSLEKGHDKSCLRRMNNIHS